MSGLFISYRRQDAAGYAARLRDELAARYGGDEVFLDLADIAPGVDFAEQLHRAVENCDSMLVVIGPRWLAATDAQGRRRIDDPNDFIRHEVAAALRLDKRVVPVLVGGAPMPMPADLPDDLKGLGMRHAIELRDSDWARDLGHLLPVLDRLLQPAGPRPTAPAAPSPQRGGPPPGRGSFLARLGQAWGVLIGAAPEAPATPGAGTSRPVAAPPPSPAPPPPSFAASPSAAPPPAPSHAVFVSYADENRAFADELVRMVEARGRRCWIAPRNIPPGSPSWAEPIVEAIAGSRLIVILLTADSIASRQVLREVTLADNEGIPMLPVQLDATPLSKSLKYFFAAGQRLELAATPPPAALQAIVPAIEQQLPAGA